MVKTTDPLIEKVIKKVTKDFHKDDVEYVDFTINDLRKALLLFSEAKRKEHKECNFHTAISKLIELHRQVEKEIAQAKLKTAKQIFKDVEKRIDCQCCAGTFQNCSKDHPQDCLLDIEAYNALKEKHLKGGNG